MMQHICRQTWALSRSSSRIGCSNSNHMFLNSVFRVANFSVKTADPALSAKGSRHLFRRTPVLNPKFHKNREFSPEKIKQIVKRSCFDFHSASNLLLEASDRDLEIRTQVFAEVHKILTDNPGFKPKDTFDFLKALYSFHNLPMDAPGAQAAFEGIFNHIDGPTPSIPPTDFLISEILDNLSWTFLVKFGAKKSALKRKTEANVLRSKNLPTVDFVFKTLARAVENLPHDKIDVSFLCKCFSRLHIVDVLTVSQSLFLKHLNNRLEMCDPKLFSSIDLYRILCGVEPFYAMSIEADRSTKLVVKLANEGERLFSNEDIVRFADRLFYYPIKPPAEFRQFVVDKFADCTDPIQPTTAAAVLNAFWKDTTTSNFDVVPILQSIYKKIRSSGTTFSGANLADAYRSMHYKYADDPVSTKLIQIFNADLRKCTVKWPARDIGKAFYGVANMKFSRVTALTTVRLLNKKMKYCPDKFSSLDLVDCMFAFKSNGMMTRLAKQRFLENLNDRIEECGAPLEPRAFVMGLEACKTLNCNGEEDRLFLRRLIQYFPDQQLLNCSEVLFALHGLESWSSDNMEVRAMLSRVVKFVNSLDTIECPRQVNPRSLASCVSAMHNMSPGVHEVKSLQRLILKLCPIVDKDSRPAQWIESYTSRFMYGMSRCSCDDPESLRMLRFIAPKLAAVRQLELINLLDCFKGLSNMSTQTPEVRQILNILMNHLVRCEQPLNLNSIITILRSISAKCHTDVLLLNLVAIMTDRLSLLGNKFAATDFLSLLRVMANFSADHVEVRAFLKELSMKMDESTNVSWNLWQISDCYMTLTKMSCDYPEVRAVLRSLNSIISDGVFDADDHQRGYQSEVFGKILYGLHSMTSDHPEVLEIASFVALKCAESSCPWREYTIGTALYGFANMDAESEVIRALLYVISTKMKESRGHFLPQDVGNALYGMHYMSSEHIEVRQVLAALADNIATCQGLLSGQEISNALFGLSQKNCSYVEIRNLISELTRLIYASPATLSPEEVFISIIGLRGLNTEYQEVRDLIAVMTEKFETCPHKLSKTTFDRGCKVLMNMRDCKEVRAALSVLSANSLV